MVCSPPGSPVHGIFQASILEWDAISFSRGSSPLRDQIFVCLLCWQVGSFPLVPPGKPSGVGRRILGQDPFDFPNLPVEVATLLVSNPLVFCGFSVLVSIIYASLKIFRPVRAPEATSLSSLGPLKPLVAEAGVTL